MFGLRLMISGLMFGLQMVIARVLGLSEYGTYAFVMAWVQMLVVVGKFGVDSASLRYIAAHHACGETALLAGFLRWSERLTLFVSGLVGLGLALSVPLLVPAERQSLRISFWLGALLIPVTVAQAMRLYQLRAVKHIWQSLVTVAVWPALAAALASIVFVLSEGPVSSPLMVMIQFLAIAACWGTATWLRSRSPLAAVSGVPGDTRKREWLRTSVTFLGVAFVVHLKDQMGVVLAGLLIDTDAAGIFAIAERFAGVALLGIESLNLFTAPRFAALHATGQIAALRQLVHQSRTMGLAFAIPVSAAVWGASHGLLGLIEPGFQAGGEILVVMLLAAIVRASAGPIAYALSMSGGERITLLASILGVAVNLAVSVLLFPWFGLMALALAQLLTNVVWAVYLTSRLKRVLSE